MTSVKRASGWVYGMSNGTKLIDGISGVYHLHMGHSSQEMTQAMCDALLVSNSYREDWLQDKAADALNRYTSPRFWQFMTVGSEAVEKAIMSLAVGKRKVTIGVFEGAFHGKSALCSILSGYDVQWASPFTVVRIGREQVIPDGLDILVYEPVQGGNGYALHTLRGADIYAYRARTGCKVIADEILCGVWRTGPFSVSEGSAPDALLIAKGLGGMLPMSAIGFLEKPDAISVGWTTTHSTSSLPLAVMTSLLPAIQRAANERESVQWPAGTRSAGSLHFIPCGDPKQVAERCRVSGVVVTAANEGFLKVAPCYNMPATVQRHIVDIINLEIQ